MENGLSEAALVLCICSENYVKKVDQGIGGSGYEGMIMTQALLKNAKSEFIISVIRNNPGEQKVPVAFGSKMYIDFSDDALYVVHYQTLLERIYGEDLKKKPALGENPFSDQLATSIKVKTKIESVLYHTPALKGKVTFRYDNNQGVYQIGNGEYLFNTRWSRSGNNSIYALGKIGYKYDESEFPLMNDIIKYDFSSNTRSLRTGQIVLYVNDYNHFAAIKIGKVKSAGHGYPYDEMEFEYKIYTSE